MTESTPACDTAPTNLRCPVCKQAVLWEGDRGVCGCQVPTAVLRGKQIPDFLGSDDPAEPVIWSWPNGWLQRLEPGLDALRTHAPLPDETFVALRDAGLIDAQSVLTPLGTTTLYHQGEYILQINADQFLPDEFLRSITAHSRVLDVGCGAGQTLRRLQRQPAELVGVDVDLAALALGCRWSQGDVRFVRGTGHALPFHDAQFSHVICRVTINYMHQRRALREMVRVLQPGGWLYLRVEGPGFDWRLLRAAPNVLAKACRLRDAMIGSVCAVTGWQPQPGSRWTGARAFATVRHFRNVLKGAGCEIIQCTPTARYGPLLAGFSLLAQRR